MSKQQAIAILYDRAIEAYGARKERQPLVSKEATSMISWVATCRALGIPNSDCEGVIRDAALVISQAGSD